MIFISILILIVAIALPSFKQEISSLLITRISAIIFIFSGALAFNALYIQSIGSGIGIYSGLFHVTIISQLLDVFLLILAALILIAWPLITSSYYNKVLNIQTLLTDGSSSVHLINKGYAGLRTPLLRPKSKFESTFKIERTNISSIPSKNVKSIGYYTPRTEYCLIVMFSALGSSLLISASDLLSMYLSIELQSFGLYILATLYRDYESSTASGLKYFLLGALSSCFILLGAGLIYTFTGLTNFESIYSLISVSGSNTPLNSLTDILSSSYKIISGVSLGIILIFIGFLFKIAAAPFHSWSPDVYDETPTQVTVWLTIIPKIAILVLLLEFISGFSINSIVDLPINILSKFNIASNLYDVTYNTSYVLQILLLVSSLFSLIVGTVVGLAQTRIKRLLAYSTISHLGFILLALAINTEQSIDSFIFYILQYSITNLNIFLIIIALGFILNKDGIKRYSNSNNTFLFDFDIKYLSSFKGEFFSNPILSLSLVICLFSMAGIPPLLGFFSKQFVLLSCVQSGYWFMALIAILTSVISASYYLRIIVLLVTSKDKEYIKLNKAANSSTASQQKNLNHDSILTNTHSFLISTLTLSILLFILKPTLLLNSTQLLSLSLFNY
jgi:NADH-ubiquinone oxidoreductase chain 2